MYATPAPTTLPDPAYQPEFDSGTATKRALAWVVDVILIGLMTALVSLPWVLDDIEPLADALDSHRQWLLGQGQFTTRRQRCQAEWLVKHLREEFGRYGIGLLGGEEALFIALAEAPRRGRNRKGGA